MCQLWPIAICGPAIKLLDGAMAGSLSLRLVYCQLPESGSDFCAFIPESKHIFILFSLVYVLILI